MLFFDDTIDFRTLLLEGTQFSTTSLYFSFPFTFYTLNKIVQIGFKEHYREVIVFNADILTLRTEF